MRRNRKRPAVLLAAALLLSALFSTSCAATALREETDALFPRELPMEYESWKEFRLRHPMKPEHTVLLRTLLPRMLQILPEEADSTESASGSDPITQDELQYLDSFIATAYYLTGYTSTGAYTTVNHTLAVNPNIIPYGTHVWIWLEDGTYVGDFYAEDTGSNMMAHPYVIDIYMGNDYDACVQWGARRVLVYTE